MGSTRHRMISAGVGDYVSDGLVVLFDGINNTGNGHDSTSTVWNALVGNITLTKVSGGSWKDNALHFEPTSASDTYHWQDMTSTSVYTDTMTVEVCMRPTPSDTVADWATGKAGVVVNISSRANNSLRRIMLSKTDVSVGGYTNGTNEFAPTGLTSLLDIRHIAVTYHEATGSDDVYCNGVLKIKSANHTYGENKRDYIFCGCSQGNSKYPYLGDIYSIRVYNRILSGEEIAHNFLIDKMRYGL